MFVKFLFYFVSLFVLLASFFLFSFVQIKEKIIMDCPKEPMAEKRSHTWQRLNGDFVDDYAWMTHKKPYPSEMMDYLKEENKYSDSWFSQHKELTNEIFEEIKTKTKETDTHFPYPAGDFYYTSRTVEGKQYEIHSRGKTEEDATSQTILDENELASPHEFFDLGAFEVSPNEQILAYSVDIVGDENYVVHFKNIETGHVYPEKLEKTYITVAWSVDSNYLFYIVQDSENRPYQLWRHKIGEDQKMDKLLFTEEDQRYYVEAKLSRSNNWIIFSTESLRTSEVWLFSASSPLSDPICVKKREQGVEYRVDDWGSHLVILTNKNAVDFQIFLADHSNPGEWKEFIKEEKGSRIRTVHCFKTFLAILDWSQGQQRIRIVHKNESYSQDIVHIKDEPHQVSFYANPLFSPPSLLLSFQSLSSPYSVCSYSFETKKCTLRKQKELLGVNLDHYVSKRIWCDNEGVLVPLDIVYSKEKIDLSSPNKLLMYGYGSYEWSCPPTFSTSRLSLLDRGFIYALAHPRGGGEMGREWYEQGKLMNKKNTFYDFIACGKHLIKEGWTTPDLLVIRGGSAGGLLVGACVTMEPKLFRAAIADVPFVDVVTTMKDDTVPLTANEWEEWGDPRQEEAEKYMWSYSPYDNTIPQSYPSLYITAGLNDMRVSVHEPAKWTAKFREVHQNDGNHPILFHTEMSAGHFGPSGRYEEWKDEAKFLTFVVAQKY